MSLGALESYVGEAVDTRVPLMPLWKLMVHFGFPLEWDIGDIGESWGHPFLSGVRRVAEALWCR